MKKKNVLKFLTGTMFNVVMGIILASIVGINPIYSDGPYKLYTGSCRTGRCIY